MIVPYSCDFCSKTLNADETLEGRTVTCPHCRHTTQLRRLTEARAELTESSEPFESSDELLSQTHGANSEPSTSGVASDTLTKGSNRSAQHDIRFELDGDPALDRETEELCAAMRKIVPCFQPNPFGISYSLEKTVVADSDDEADSVDPDASSANPYDVDELIKGVDRPDGGF